MDWSTDMSNVVGYKYKSVKHFNRHIHQGKTALKNSGAGRIVQVFLNVDFRYGHDGLTVYALKNKVDVKQLNNGQYVVFVNTRRDKVKVYAANNIVAYMQLPRGRKVDMGVIRLIPKAFSNSGNLDYDGMLKDVIEKSLASKNTQIVLSQ